MPVLGIESSCDETAAAVVACGRVVLSNVVASQIPVHQPFGGVVPELASRHHLVSIVGVVRESLRIAFGDSEEAPDGGEKGRVLHGSQRGDTKEENSNSWKSCLDLLGRLDGVAVTCGPGLVGSLMIGVQIAKGLCAGSGLPLCGVNHLEAHLEAVYAVDPKEVRGTSWPLGDEFDPETALPAGPPTPHVALVVSGGHTALLYVRARGDYRLLGSTRDDAAGEAFDKVAKMLNLGYPGGVTINRLAHGGDPRAIAFPRALADRSELDFSFSGLKTAVRVHLERVGPPDSEQAMRDLCASVQEAIVDVLVRKAFTAVKRTTVRSLVLAGGVAANTRLQDSLRVMGEREGVGVYVPDMQLCTDNAAMVAVAGARRISAGEVSSFELDAIARAFPVGF